MQIRDREPGPYCKTCNEEGHVTQWPDGKNAFTGRATCLKCGGEFFFRPVVDELSTDITPLACPECGCDSGEILEWPSGAEWGFWNGRARCGHCRREFTWTIEENTEEEPERTRARRGHRRRPAKP